MRLFVAVELAPAVAERLDAFGSELQRRTAALSPHARVTWIPVGRLHLTVRFIGEVDDAQAAAIGAALGPSLEVPGFELGFEGAGAFPSRGAPRVLWAGISQGLEALKVLEREVSTRLATCGIAREDRPYAPHLTLARVREGARLRVAPLFEGLADSSFGTMPVDAITLFHSRLSPRGPTYVPVQRTSLHGRT